MPNHIKNKIELTGSKDQITELIEKFSTHYKETQSMTHDGRLNFIDNTGNYGRFDKEKSIFTKDGENNVEYKTIPSNFSPVMNKAWTRFPDFEKVIPTPEILKDYEPNHTIVVAVKKEKHADVSTNALLASLQLENRQNQSTVFENKADQESFNRGCKAYDETGFVYWYDWRIKNWGTKWSAYSCEKISKNVLTFETAWNGVPEMIKEISKQFPDVTITYKYADEDTGYNCGIYVFHGGTSAEHEVKNGSIEAYELAFELKPENKKYYKIINGNYESISDEEYEKLEDH